MRQPVFISPGLAEILGALTGDRGAFKETQRPPAVTTSYIPKAGLYVTKVCVGLDREWGHRLSNLVFQDCSHRGSVYWDKNEWRFEARSQELYKHLHQFYRPEWRARTWRISPLLFTFSVEIRRSFIRGYFDADGYPYFSKARNHVYIQVNSVNYHGLADGRRLLESLGFHPGLYRRYKARDVWELTIHRKFELIKFHNEIGFSLSRKQSDLMKMLVRRWPHDFGSRNSEGRI